MHINISDRWPDRHLHELMMSLRGLGTDAQSEHVDECLSSIVGRTSSSTDGAPAHGV